MNENNGNGGDDHPEDGLDVTHPDIEVEDQLTALEVFRTKLRSALDGKNMEDIQYQMALVVGRINHCEKIETEPLSEAVRTRLQNALQAARDDVKNTETIVELARSLSKPSTSQEDASEHYASIQYKWEAHPYHGKEEEWVDWWQSFRTLVDKNKKLNADWKMKALMECLKGEAAAVLGNMDKTGANYVKAIELLKKRFGNPLVLSKAYYRQLSTLPPATDLKTQRTVLDKLTAIVRNLEGLDDIHLDENLISRSICQKFEREFLRWVVYGLKQTYPPAEKYSPQQLLSEMEKIMQIDTFIMTMMECSITETSSEPKAVGVLAVGQIRSVQKSGSANHGPPAPKKPAPQCIFCSDESHFSVDCRRFATIAARKQKLDEQRRCHNCLLQFHTASKCRGAVAKCGRCSRQHPTALCVAQRQNDRNDRNRR